MTSFTPAQLQNSSQAEESTQNARGCKQTGGRRKRRKRRTKTRRKRRRTKTRRKRRRKR